MDVAAEALRTVIIVLFVFGVGAAPTLPIAISEEETDKVHYQFNFATKDICQRIMHCPAQEEEEAVENFLAYCKRHPASLKQS